VIQSSVLEEAEHRPWPLPRRRWFMAQTWCDLLFAHWPVKLELLRRAVPPQLPLDVYDGRAWIGVSPFRVANLRLHGTPPVPGVSWFDEVNVRTYVTIDGKPGIYFLSLDASSRLAVLSARRAYRLPYFRSHLSIEGRGPYRVAGARVSGDGPPAELDLEYAPAGERFTAAPGSLDHWLTERYCLYTLAGSAVQRAEIHHPPWPLQPATADIARNTMAEGYGIGLEGEAVLHYAARQDVVLWTTAPV